MQGLYPLLGAALIAALIIGLNWLELHADRTEPMPAYRIKGARPEQRT